MAPTRKRPEEMTREELLELVLSEHEEGIWIKFSGKGVARRLARKVQPRTSRRLAKYSCGSEEEQARNLVIEGENLQAMVTLYGERNQVDLILADPPYNTGKDFRYNDRWDEDPNDPGLGELVDADDGGRHTKWMKFMWPRLTLMRDMLKPSGVLAICIDHNELFHLGQMLDEIFQGNRLAIINWQKSYSPKSDSAHVSTGTEYVLVYAKDDEVAKTGLELRTAEMDARYSSPDGDPDQWKGENAFARSAKTHQGMIYAIQSPFTGELHYPPDGGCWRSEKRRMKTWLNEWIDGSGLSYTTQNRNDGKQPALVLKGPKRDGASPCSGQALCSGASGTRSA